jgi:hypothetical protein
VPRAGRQSSAVFAAAIVTAVATTLALAAPAHADPGWTMLDYGFLDAMKQGGVFFGSDRLMLKVAHDVCDDTRKGWVRPLEITSISETYGISRNDAAFFVGASITGYCPDLAIN